MDTKNLTGKQMTLISIGVIILAIFIIGLVSPSTETITETEVVETYEVIFDAPSLLGKTATQAQNILGEAQTYEQVEDLDWETENYYIGATLEDNKITAVFWSYDKPRASQEEVMAAGNINPNSDYYAFKIKQWLNPSLAEKNGGAKIAGVHICQNSTNYWCN